MESFFSLCFGKENVRYEVVKIDASVKIKRRLLDLGFVDTSVVILKKSHFNGVFLLQIRSYVLALKRKEVSSIMVKNYG
jgi:Fe2+ transport system protein FeoA